MKSTVPVILVLCCWLLAPSTAVADIYLKIEGISGESALAPAGDDRIEILSFSWGYSRETQAAVARPVSTGEVTVTKAIDKSTPLLMQALSNGEVIPQMRLEQRLADGSTLAIRMENIRIRSLRVNSDGDTLVLDYGRIELTYTPQRTRGAAVSSSAEGTVRDAVLRQPTRPR